MLAASTTLHLKLLGGNHVAMFLPWVLPVLYSSGLALVSEWIFEAGYFQTLTQKYASFSSFWVQRLEMLGYGVEDAAPQLKLEVWNSMWSEDGVNQVAIVISEPKALPSLGLLQIRCLFPHRLAKYTLLSWGIRGLIFSGMQQLGFLGSQLHRLHFLA